MDWRCTASEMLYIQRLSPLAAKPHQTATFTMTWRGCDEALPSLFTYLIGPKMLGFYYWRQRIAQEPWEDSIPRFLQGCSHRLPPQQHSTLMANYSSVPTPAWRRFQARMAPGCSPPRWSRRSRWIGARWRCHFRFGSCHICHYSQPNLWILLIRRPPKHYSPQRSTCHQHWSSALYR